MKRSLLLLLILMGTLHLGFAGTSFVPEMPPPDPRFDAGRWELDLMGGFISSPIGGVDRKHYRFDQGQLRVGRMLTSPLGDGWLRGNVEILLGIAAGGVSEGLGNAFGAADLHLRYNFIHPQTRFVPYFQIGAGTLMSDIAQHKKQTDIGGRWEADLRGGPGIRCLLNPQWSIVGELVFEHISNANTQKHNYGINGLGGLIGVARSF